MPTNYMGSLTFDLFLHVCFFQIERLLELPGRSTPCVLYVNLYETSPIQNSRRLTFGVAPALSAVKYRRVSYDGKIAVESPYQGAPSPELDKAWHDFLENYSIRVSKDELRKMNRSAFELSDGSGYFGQLRVYHHLHCLVYLP